MVDRSAEIAHIKATLERLDGAGRRGSCSYAVFFRLRGVTRCSVGFSYQFPDYILVTVAISSRRTSTRRPRPSTRRRGKDSSAEGPHTTLAGIDEAFWANLYPCEVRGRDIVFTGG